MEESRSLLVLDTNIFLEAHRRYYALDICPGFWESLLHYAREGKLVSIDRVRAEIVGPEELTGWLQQAHSELFATSAEEVVVDTFMHMQSWVQESAQFRPEAKAEFARVADGWVAAYAKAHDGVVVTHEVFRANVRRNVPLPNVCRKFGVAYRDTFDMLRKLGVKFDWHQPS